jgi:hypothetical protein
MIKASRPVSGMQNPQKMPISYQKTIDSNICGALRPSSRTKALEDSFWAKGLRPIPYVINPLMVHISYSWKKFLFYRVFVVV